ncbi:MAG TPA: hypothetical protein VMY88_11320 [Acidimicrobiales bacterium]|nr:hypothetical protein [Acidimicrobiales bacterium]
MAVPKVEVETESAGRYPDVDLETLHRLVSQLSDENSYVILHRSDKPDEFAQAAMARRPTAKTVKGSFIVEFKDASGEQCQAKVTDITKIQTALAGWAFDLDGWKEDLKWKPLKLNRAVNLNGNCVASEADGIWTASFPALGFTATGPTEDEAMAELRTVIFETANRDADTRAAFAKWSSENLIEMSPEELERLKGRRLSPEQEERINQSFAELMRTREVRKPAKRKTRS